MQIETLQNFWSTRNSWIVCFAVIVTANIWYVYDPIYWDMILGMFAQSYWLSQHDLNYSALLTQPTYGEGGPRVYSIGWLPTMIYAGCYYIGLHVTTINILGHVLVWVCSATILQRVFILLKPHVDQRTNILACAALTSCPLFMAQTSTFNFEAILCCLSILAFSYYSEGRFKASTACLLLAFHIHPRGAIALVGMGAISVFEYYLIWFHGAKATQRFESSKANQDARPVAFFYYAVAFAIFLIYMYTTARGGSNLAILAAFQNTDNFYSVFVWMPEFAMLTGLFLWAVGRDGSLFFGFQMRDAKPAHTGGLDGIDFSRKILAQRCAVFIVVYLAFMLNVEHILVRYHLIIYPFLAVGILARAGRTHGSSRLASVILLSIIAINIVNYHGTIYRQLFAINILNNGFVLERSMEYHSDLRLNLDIAEYVESNWDLKKTIFVTHWPLTQILSIPELGYVTSGDVQVASIDPTTYANVRPLSDIYYKVDATENVTQIVDQEVVWIVSPNCFFQNKFPPQLGGITAPFQNSHELRVGDNRAIIFQLGREFTERSLSKMLEQTMRAGQVR